MAESVFLGASTIVTADPITGDGSIGDPIGLNTPLDTGHGGTGGTSLAAANVAVTTGTLSQFAATTSAELRGVLSDETGSGLAVFATSPVLTTPNIGAATGTSVDLSGDAKAATFHVGAAAGVDASIVIPAVATITVTKGIITAVV